ncbi:MAG TPA: hypothetical protein VGI81_22010 [Tepidisphaeraceae bacterium]
MAAAEDLRKRTEAVLEDVRAREAFEQVLAFEIEQCRLDAGLDPVQREMIDFVGRLLRLRAPPPGTHEGSRDA